MVSNFESDLAVRTIRAMARAFDQVVTRQDRDQLARLLRQARLEAGLEQQDLAARLAVPVSVLSKMETGHRGVDVLELRALCAAIGLPLGTFAARLEDILAEAS
jgi:ribosome-binding protein aMBF1 (putative translation factor)